MNEFDFIQKYLTGLAGPEGLGLLDDAASWTPPPGSDAVISMDTLVEGVHFPAGKFDAELAQKLIRVNISDIIAKGTDPVGYMLSLSMNETVSNTDIAAFCAGLAVDQENYDIKLWGGDTTRTTGPNVLTVTIFGTVPTGEITTRSSAQPGDLLCVFGDIGDAYLGLKVHLKQMGIEVFKSEYEHWLASYHIPKPAFEIRSIVRDLASAALDISDGLLADAQHMANASKVRLTIDLETIPVSAETTTWINARADQNKARLEIATGGDDYQVLATVKPKAFEEMRSNSEASGVKVTKIGNVDHGAGVRILDKFGKEIVVDRPGYTHF